VQCAVAGQVGVGEVQDAERAGSGRLHAAHGSGAGCPAG
jgi:hypothetical protein